MQLLQYLARTGKYYIRRRELSVFKCREISSSTNEDLSNSARIIPGRDAISRLGSLLGPLAQTGSPVATEYESRRHQVIGGPDLFWSEPTFLSHQTSSCQIQTNGKMKYAIDRKFQCENITKF